jgi:hypothetical protein
VRRPSPRPQWDEGQCNDLSCSALLITDKLCPSQKASFPAPQCRKEIDVKGPAMAISQDLLDILACPACKAKVELKPDGSALKCVECNRVYPIRDDIPVMLIDEATIEDEQPARNS